MAMTYFDTDRARVLQKKKKKKLVTERHSLNYQPAELKATDVVDSFRLLQTLLSLHEYTIL